MKRYMWAQTRRGRPSSAAQLLAFVLASLRYLTSVSAQVEDELARWRELARTCPDPSRRAHALAKLRDAGAHVRLNAMIATLAPRRHRPTVVTAIVALEVMYDYLDALTERAEQLAEADRLYAPLVACFRDDVSLDADDPYARALAETVRSAFRSLPQQVRVAPIASEVAARSGATQARCHVLDAREFERWVSTQPRPESLAWWEAAASWSAEIITLHALIVLAASSVIADDAGARLVAAYEHICVVATLLDSVLDASDDQLSHDHRYIGYYPSPEAAGAGVAGVVRGAMKMASTLPLAAHHTMTVSGIAAYYLSAPEAADAQVPTDSTIRELRPVIVPLLLSFRLLRRLRATRFPPPRAESSAPGAG